MPPSKKQRKEMVPAGFSEAEEDATGQCLHSQSESK